MRYFSKDKRKAKEVSKVSEGAIVDKNGKDTLKKKDKNLWIQIQKK